MTAEPYENVPVKHPNGQMRPYDCETRVYSSARNDIGGHQCGKTARWRIADFDKWGDILTCGLHKNPHPFDRSTSLLTIFGYVKGEPTSWRFLRAKRLAAKG